MSQQQLYRAKEHTRGLSYRLEKLVRHGWGCLI
jgi:hypothetical protein